MDFSKYELVTSGLLCVILLLLIYDDKSKQLTSINSVYFDNQSPPPWCSTLLWTHVPSQNLMASFVAEFEYLCKKLHPIPVHTLKARLDTAHKLSVEHPTLLSNFFMELAKNSVIEVVIGSRDRAAALHKVLSLLQPPRVTGLRITVLYSGSEHAHNEAYLSLANEFVNVNFVDRGLEKNAYFVNLLKILDSSTSSLFMVVSDDTLFKRPFRMEFLGALLRFLGGPDYSIVFEMRLAHTNSFWTTWVNDEIPLLDPNGIVSTFKVANVSGCNTHVPHIEPECYNRHIDGPLYLLKNALSDLRTLPQDDVQHPGGLEGMWMRARNKEIEVKEDYTVMLENNVAFNTDLGGHTVREDRFGDSGSVKYGFDLRRNFSVAFAAGCRQAILTPQNEEWLQMNNDYIRRGISLPWHCPEGVIPPENCCVHSC